MEHSATVSDEVYERARLSRDARFDGRFFIGVKTTGIYCRPVCPANPPRSENVSFFPTAAAASEAGFRPCLRCRPECAPGTPAWAGTSTTVNRGLRLIAEGALDDSEAFGASMIRFAKPMGVRLASYGEVAIRQYQQARSAFSYRIANHLAGASCWIFLRSGQHPASNL
jgi:methylphosphotriester-DNA--protein-cysteine methyltransferase